ncbi:kelch-like protein 1 isoform X2 [Thrips palmi]|uniref:Kelch-like protein 1 isoform X2 n=1 Tax=Thrips palmi TaxID=161013 RepID=A0A6P9A3K1_THRPL|nr:kelch-like protein 1 isoform X2 [Thrips palmi]
MSKRRLPPLPRPAKLSSTMSSRASNASSESQQQGHGRLLASYKCSVPVPLSYPTTAVILEGGLQEPEVKFTVTAQSTSSAITSFYLMRGLGWNKVAFTAEVKNDTVVLKEDSAVPGNDLIYTTHPNSPQLNYFNRGGSKRVYVKISVYEKELPRRAEKYFDLGFDLGKLLKQEVLSDVVLQVQSGDRADGGVAREFRAHKAVLSARSSVFQCLFTTDMAECRTATVPVNFSVEVTERILWYAYTGQMEHEASEQRAPSITENMDVLAAADFYDMQPLKSYCEELLMEQIASKPEEVLQTIVLADKYGAARLKRVALDLAASDPKQIQQHPEWLQFLQDHRSLVNELFASLAERVTATPR